MAPTRSAGNSIPNQVLAFILPPGCFVVARWMGELDDERLRLVLDSHPASDVKPLDEPPLARHARS